MPISFNVKADIKQVTRSLNRWEKRAVPAAANAALNKAAAKVRTTISSDLAKEMGIKVGEVKKQINVRRSNFTTLTAKLIARGRRWNIIRFKAKELKTALKASPWNKARKWKTGFIGNQGRTAFLRLSRKRLDIKPLRGPGMASEFVRDRAVALMQRISGSEFLKNFRHELKRRIARL